MQAEIDKDKHQCLATLKRGLEDGCADDITQVIINLEDGTCDYLELIPALEAIALEDWFCYFDDNGAGGMPHADQGRKTSFRSWALAVIENIRANSALDSSSVIHRALKSNSTSLIRLTLEKLQYAARPIELSLLPILEKIARKDVYKKYSYISGHEVDCHLGELARSVMQLILQDDQTPAGPTGVSRVCKVCGTLPDDLTVNTGRDEYFPAAFRQLVGMDDEYRAEFRCCPSCRTYFNWMDMPQMYGSGNNDEERLVRLSREQSVLLDKLFLAGAGYLPDKEEVDTIMSTLSIELLIPVLRFQLRRNARLVSAFVPRLLLLLGQNNDTALWDLLQGYVSNSSERAAEILDAFQASDSFPPSRLVQMLHRCLRLMKKQKP